jgi:5-formyltetrahydrofolate cyclo-ligase
MDKQLLRKDLVAKRENLSDKLTCIDLLTQAMRIWLMGKQDAVIGAYWPIKGDGKKTASSLACLSRAGLACLLSTKKT